VTEKNILKGLLFLLIGFIMGSCNKPTDLGSDVFDEDSIDILVEDSFGIEVKTRLRSPELVYVSEITIPNTQLIGQLDDPMSGRAAAEVFSQIDYAPQVDGNPLAGLVMDSARIVLLYDTFGLYGNLEEEVTINVYELEEEMDIEGEYDSDRQFASNKMDPFTSLSFIPAPYDSVPQTIGDTVIKFTPRLYIPVDTNKFARLKALDSTTWAEPDSFREVVFKGFHFGLEASNTMLGFDFESISQIQLFYHNPDSTDDTRLFTFTFDDGVAKTNFFSHDYSGSFAADILKDSSTTQTDTVCFWQEMQGLSPKITITGLTQLHGSLINSAELILTEYELENPDNLKYPAPNLVTIQEDVDTAFVDILDTRIGKREATNSGSIIGYIASFGGGRTRCDTTSGQNKYIYTSAITSHLQDAISNKQDKATVYISSFYQPESPRRTAFYGSGTKYPVRLVVRYTKVL